MKRCTPALAALSATFALMATAEASDTVQIPRTAAARAAGNLIARAERAMTSYVAACASRDAKALNRITTEDVRLEFALDEPGTYLALESGSLMAGCVPGVTPKGNARVWIYPTNDADAVFVRYESSAGSPESSSQQLLALVEMRGEQIARMRNFVGASDVVASAAPMAAVTPCRALAIQ